MQTIKTTLMRAAAMAIAVLTSASLMLHPGSLKAYDYWVDPYDREYEDPLDGANTKCGFQQTTKVCGRAAAGGLSAWLSRNTGFNADGNGGYNTYYEKDCDAGVSKACEFRNDCRGSSSRIAIFQPDCTITIR
jgi:hypothetical protein